MIQAAKLLIVDDQEKYLMLYRSEHPRFGMDPDLPGGTLEDGESLIDTMLREVREEAGIDIDRKAVIEVYSGSNYSYSGTHYSLYAVRLLSRPKITISWEHTSFEWLGKDDFLDRAKKANDTYMHMVYDMVKDGIL